MPSRLLNLPSLPGWWKRQYTLILIVLLSTMMHAWSVWQLPVDYDEPVYLHAGEEYAKLISGGDLTGIINFQENREHPPLVKLLYSVPFLLGFNQPGSQLPLFAARSISAIFGVLAVYFVSRRSMWAGFFLAFQSMTLKYTSQAYLEALPMLMVVLAALFLEKAKDSHDWRFWVSAVCFGIAGAAKYPYLIVGFVLIYMLIRKEGFRSIYLISFLSVSLISFLILNPNFWLSPFNEILNVVRFHSMYSQSLHVQLFNYPWYQPALFLASSVPWHPQVFFFITLDEFIFWIALVGLFWELKRGGWTGIWFFLVFIFLLIWPTKWPQYTLMLTPAMALLAGFSVERAILWIRPRDDYWNYLEEMLPQPPRITWWILILFVGVLLLGKVGYEIQLASARRGWDTYTSQNSPLMSNFVLDINTDKRGHVAIATRKGLEIWDSELQIPVGGEKPIQFSLKELGLMGQEVKKICYDSAGDVYWLGSDSGVTRVGDTVINFTNNQIGCQICSINDMAIDLEGQVWAASNEGIFLYSMNKWHNFTGEFPGLEDQVVQSILIQEDGKKPVIWAGTLSGISQYDFTTQIWTNTNWAGNFFGWGGVQDVIETSDNKIIAATSGGGVGILDKETWNFYRNTNSPMRSNTVLSVTESPEGDYWFGMGYPTQPGGYLLKFNTGAEWQKYFLNTSGYQEGEPVDLEFDQFGRIWIATSGQGIQTFYLENK